MNALEVAGGALGGWEGIRYPGRSEELNVGL